MNRKEILTEEIKSIGYIEEEKILEVEFYPGGIYHYAGGLYHFFDVSKKHYEAMLNADSPFEYLAWNIEDYHSYKSMDS